MLFFYVLFVISLTYIRPTVTYITRLLTSVKSEVIMDAPFEYIFPAIKGVQAGREYFISMCPMRLLPKIFLFDEEELVPELRAQRTLNKGRLPEMCRYILDNQKDYVFSAITASVDADVRFEPLSTAKHEKSIGLIHIPMSAKFIINDGQHRRAAIEMALRERPDLGDESIAVVFFLDVGLERCQQMFSDLNRHAVRPSRSLGVLYDYRDEKAEIAKIVAFKSKTFKDLVDTERSTLSHRSRKLFTLSAIYSATSSLFAGNGDDSLEKRADAALSFWEEVGKQIPEWKLVRDRKMNASEVRQDFIHSHGITLQALGKVGNMLLRSKYTTWKQRLRQLKKIDWTRSNAKLWEGRAMIGGRVSKASHNVTLTTNVIKTRLKLKLTPEEQRVEKAFLRGDYA